MVFNSCTWGRAERYASCDLWACQMMRSISFHAFGNDSSISGRVSGRVGRGFELYLRWRYACCLQALEQYLLLAWRYVVALHCRQCVRYSMAINPCY